MGGKDVSASAGRREGEGAGGEGGLWWGVGGLSEHVHAV